MIELLDGRMQIDTSRCGEFDGIGDEIGEDLHETFLVGHDVRWDRRIDFEQELNVARSYLSDVQTMQRSEEFRHVHRFRHQLHPSSIEFVHVQQVVGQMQHHVNGHLRSVQIVLIPAGRVSS